MWACECRQETVGDAYLVASNLLRHDKRHRLTALTMAVTLINVVRDVRVTLPDGTCKQLEARCGLHTGPVAAGVVGLKRSVRLLRGNACSCCRAASAAYGVERMA